MKKLSIFIITVYIVIFSTTLVAQSWQTVGNVGFTDSAAYNIQLKFDKNGIPYVSYLESINTYYRPRVMKYDGKKWVYINKAFLDTIVTTNSSIAIDNKNIPYLAYIDSNYNANIIKLYDTNCVILKQNNMSVMNVKIVIDKNNTPYISVLSKFGNICNVLKCNDKSWKVLGGINKSNNYNENNSILIDNDTTPYIFYSDAVYYGFALVKKYIGNNWVNVGNPSFSDASIRFSDIIMDNKNIPHVAYVEDYDTYYKIAVKKLNNSYWMTIGDLGFISDGSNLPFSFAVDSNSVPYIAFDSLYTNKGTVLKFDGADWVPIDTTGFSDGGSKFASLAINKNNIPFIAYQDLANGGKATVKYFGYPVSAPESSENVKNINFTLSPNPSASQIRLSASFANISDAEVKIYNLFGEIVFSKKYGLVQQIADEINMRAFPAGIYYCMIKAGGEAVTEKVVVVK